MEENKLEWIPDDLVNADNEKVTVEDKIKGYKLLMVVYSASWWGGCTPFKAMLKGHYEAWNKDGEKNLQVIIISGDQNEDGFKLTMEGAPWVALKFGADKSAFETKVPCTGYPTPGIITPNGDVIEADVYNKINEGSFAEWNAKIPSWSVQDKHSELRYVHCTK